MSQNKWKIIDYIIGHLSNAVVHLILSSASPPEEILGKYKKEIKNSFDEAVRYMGLINPKDSSLTESDITYIKERIEKRVKNELLRRISQGYGNVNLHLIDSTIDNMLKQLNITS